MKVLVLLIAYASAQMLNATQTLGCKAMDQDIRIHDCISTPDCVTFPYEWKLSLNASETCLVGKQEFGNAFEYFSTCPTSEIYATYTYWTYPASDPTGKNITSRSQCNLAGKDI